MRRLFVLLCLSFVAIPCLRPQAFAQYYGYPPGYYPPYPPPPPYGYRPPYYPPSPPPYVGHPPPYGGNPAYSQENCGTPDQPKPCPPMPRVPLPYYPANRH